MSPNPLFLNNILILTEHEELYTELNSKCTDLYKLEFVPNALMLKSALKSNFFDLYIIDEAIAYKVELIKSIEKADPHAIFFYMTSDELIDITYGNKISYHSPVNEVLNKFKKLFIRLIEDEQQYIYKLNDEERAKFMTILHKKPNRQRGTLFDFPLLVIDSKTKDYKIGDKFGRHKETYLTMRDKLIMEDNCSEYEMAIRLWRGFIYKRDDFFKRSFLLFFIDTKDPFIFNNPNLLDEEDDEDDEFEISIEELQDKYLSYIKGVADLFNKFHHFVIIDIHGNVID